MSPLVCIFIIIKQTVRKFYVLRTLFGLQNLSGAQHQSQKLDPRSFHIQYTQ